jgi:hypothetical protein
VSFWGYSSVGRALAWHARGQQFDSAYLHQKFVEEVRKLKLAGLKSLRRKFQGFDPIV